VTDPRPGRGTWLQRIGSARRILLFATPVMLVLFMVSSANADHFGWGFVPWLVLLVVLPLVLVYVFAEFVLFGAKWLLSHRQRGGIGAVDIHLPAVLRFDLVVLALYLVAWVTILVHDRWFG